MPVKCYRRILRKCEERVGVGDGAEPEFHCDGWGIAGHQMIAERWGTIGALDRDPEEAASPEQQGRIYLMRDKLPKRALL